MYKTESVLGLVGSILGAVFAALSLLGALLVAVFFDFFRAFIFESFEFSRSGLRFESGPFLGAVSGIIIAAIIAVTLLAAASVVLGFMGTAKLKRGDKGGGVLLVIGGALAFISGIEFIPFILLLVGGIMALTKKESAAP